MPKTLLSFLSLLAISLYLVSCSGRRTPDYNPDIGPFDEDGNYVEAWADNPPKRSRRASKPKPTKKEEPKTTEKKSGGFWAGIFGGGDSKKEKEVVAKPKPKPEPRTYTPPKPVVRETPKTTYRPKPKPAPKPKVKPKPKPKPVKVKPKTRRHTVKAGDTLYGLSRKYGVSVSAIQKANKLSGTNIRLGATLLIPAK